MMCKMVISGTTTEVSKCNIDRRTTCDGCGCRRKCSTTWVHFELTYRDRKPMIKVDMGDLCADCREILKREVMS